VCSSIRALFEEVRVNRLHDGPGWAGLRGRSARTGPVRAQFFFPQLGPEPKRTGPGWAGSCQDMPRYTKKRQQLNKLAYFELVSVICEYVGYMHVGYVCVGCAQAASNFEDIAKLATFTQDMAKLAAYA
jgi:hypothetical protein